MSTPGAAWPEPELAHLLGSRLVLFFSVDRELRFRRVSESYARASENEPPSWFVGRSIFAMFPQPQAEALFREVLETGGRLIARSQRFAHPRRPEIGILYWDMALRATRDAAGNVDGLTCVMTDATEATRARLDLARQAELLAATTRGMEVALSRARLDDPDGILGPLGNALGADTGALTVLEDRGAEGLFFQPVLRWRRTDGIPVVMTSAGIDTRKVSYFFERFTTQPAFVTQLSDAGPDPIPSLHALGYRTIVSAPLLAQDRLRGSLYFSSYGTARSWGSHEVAALRSFAAMLGGQLSRDTALVRLTEQEHRSTRLARRLETAIEDERRRVGRELHDGVGQRVGTLKLGLEALAATAPEALAGRVDTLARGAQEVMGELRRVARNLHPAVIDDLGLAAALEGLVDEVRHLSPGIRIAADIETRTGELPERLRVPIYRIAQEALQNVVRHAGAQHVELRLWRDAGDWVLAVTDDGRGYEPANTPSGMGARSMRERAELSDGSFEAISSPGEGTIVRVQWPETPADAPAPD